MWLRIKNVDILGFHWKMQHLGGGRGEFLKNQNRGGLPKMGGLESLQIYGGLANIYIWNRYCFYFDLSKIIDRLIKRSTGPVKQKIKYTSPYSKFAFSDAINLTSIGSTTIYYISRITIFLQNPTFAHLMPLVRCNFRKTLGSTITIYLKC